MVKKSDVVELLVACHRRCCICHRFCGFRMELHHIKPRAEGGTDEPSNLIPLCFDCHAEVNLYNINHPRGRKYSNDELIAHKKQWIELCQSSAEFLASIPVTTDIGPLQGLYNELRFNEIIAARPDATGIGATFEDLQFTRCINEGVFWLIDQDVLMPIYEAYFGMKHANALIGSRQHAPDETLYQRRTNEAFARMKIARPLITKALNLLDKYLNMDEVEE